MKKPSFNKVVAAFGIAIIFIIVYAAIGSLGGAGLTSGLFPAYQSPQQQAPINPPAITSQNANFYGLTHPSQAGTSPSPETPSTSRTQSQNGIYGFENDSTVDPDKISKLVDAGIQRKYLSDPNNYITWGQANLDNPNYKDWHDGLKETHLMTDGKIDPLKAAPIMFPSSEEAGLFKKYCQAMININTEVNKANYGVTTVFPKYLSPEGTASKEIIKHQVENLISDADGPGTGECVSGEIDRALLLGNKNDMAGRLDAIIQKHAPRYTEILKEIGIQ